MTPAFTFPDPSFASDATYTQLRECLLGAGFSAHGIPQALGVRSLETFRALPRPTMGAITSGGRPIDTFVRLFLMGEPVSSQALADAIAPMTVDDWSRAGIVNIQGFYAFPTLGLALFDSLLLFHDCRNDVGPNYVMGVAGTSSALAHQAIFAPGRLALDLGTGCGVLAFLAARTCERVLATDKNPRAVAMAKFNARVNAIDNVDFDVGDLFDPAKAYLANRGPDARFDFIYCNPPFVITPGGRYMYCDSGMKGDGIVEAVVRGAPALLAEHGVAQLVCNWIHPADRPWQQRVSSWVQGGACDALVFLTRTLAPVDYAATWIEETEKSATPEARWKMLGEWMQEYQSLGIAAISYGVISLRKHTPDDRPNFIAFDEVPESVTSQAGPHIVEILACREFMLGLGQSSESDARLADTVLAWSPHLRIDQTLRPPTAPGAGATPGMIAGPLAASGSAWKPEFEQIRLARGYAFPRQLDSRQLEFVMALDGTCSVRQVVEQVAAQAKAPPAALLPVCLKLCRGLLERAYVLPTGLTRAGNP